MKSRRHRNPPYAPEGLERRLSPSGIHPPAEVVPMGKTGPSRPVPTVPVKPTAPKGDGTPPVSDPNAPGGTTEPA